MASHPRLSDDNTSASSHLPHHLPENHSNTSTYPSLRGIPSNRSRRAASRASNRSHPSSSRNHPLGRRRDVMSGSRNFAPGLLDPNPGPQLRDQVKMARTLQRRLNDNGNPDSYQRMEVIFARNAQNERVQVRALFCRGQRFSAIHPYCLQSLGIVPEDLPLDIPKAFLYPDGLTHAVGFTDLVIEHPIWGIETFLVLYGGAPYKGVGIYIGQRLLNKYLGGNLPPPLPPDSAASGQGSYWPAGIPQSDVSSEGMTLNTITSVGDWGPNLPVSLNTPVTPMSSLSRASRTMTGTPGDGTPPPRLGQWESSLGFPEVSPCPIPSTESLPSSFQPNQNRAWAGPVFSTQPNPVQYATHPGPSGPAVNHGSQSTVDPGYQPIIDPGYLDNNMMPGYYWPPQEIATASGWTAEYLLPGTYPNQ